MNIKFYYLDKAGNKDLIGVSQNASAVPRIGDSVSLPRLPVLIVKDVVWDYVQSHGTSVSVIVGVR